MADIRRESPVRFNIRPKESQVRDHWTVAMEYENEGTGPWIVDLAHKTRWDLQDSGIGNFAVGEMPVPADPGACGLADGVLVNRMNRTQASIYHLMAAPEAFPEHPGYTDVTESTVFLALFGPQAFRVAEKLTNLDFLNPAKTAPFLLQGPFCHVPCQIVTLEKTAGAGGGFLLTCSRGYGDSMVEAILEAGNEFGLRPAGEKRFSDWMMKLQENQ
jgi:hypothetical protein